MLYGMLDWSGTITTTELAALHMQIERFLVLAPLSYIYGHLTDFYTSDLHLQGDKVSPRKESDESKWELLKFQRGGQGRICISM